MSDEVTPFRIDVPEDELRDLRERLGRTRWPEAETVGDWSQGVPLAWLRELCEYWADGYDWRATEARLNAVPQFRTEIDGLGIHFLHVRSPHPDALPLVLTHGWPGSVVEFLKVLGPLADPVAHGGDAADAFHVVCPSLPGYGFSDKPARPGWNVQRVAAAWAVLMGRLGYRRYGAQGGDWGTSVSASIGQQDPGHVAGIHLTPPLAPPDPATLGELTEAERAALASLEHAAEWEAGYSREHATRPQTVGYALVDSPAGLCAWIVEKFWAWSDHDGRLEDVLSRDELLDDVTLYWLPRTGASSARLYRACTGRASGRWTGGSPGRCATATRSRSPPAARSSPRSCSAPPAAGPSDASRTSAGGTSWARAAISPPSSSRSCS
jgi:epoxide hydrolase